MSVLKTNARFRFCECKFTNYISYAKIFNAFLGGISYNYAYPELAQSIHKACLTHMPSACEHYKS